MLKLPFIVFGDSVFHIAFNILTPTEVMKGR